MQFDTPGTDVDQCAQDEFNVFCTLRVCVGATTSWMTNRVSDWWIAGNLKFSSARDYQALACELRPTHSDCLSSRVHGGPYAQVATALHVKPESRTETITLSPILSSKHLPICFESVKIPASCLARHHSTRIACQ